MRTVSVSDIVKDVKIILDENIKDNPILDCESNQLQLNQLIISRIPDAVRSIHGTAPSNLLDGVDIQGDLKTLPDGSGYIELPSDFMRLVFFQLNEWKRPVLEPILDTDSVYFMQKSRFHGVRGNIDKPVCALTMNSGILEFYSVTPGSEASIKVAKYLPLPLITDNKIDVCDKLYTSITWECGGIVATSLKDQSASALFEIAKNYT